MPSYKELQSIEEQSLSGRGSLSEDETLGEDDRFLSKEARWRELSSFEAWVKWIRRSWAVVVMHLALLSVNILIVTLYMQAGSFSNKVPEWVMPYSEFS